MKYLKKFETHYDYLDFLETEDYIKPNVSWCLDENGLHYNKKPIETRIEATYQVTKGVCVFGVYQVTYVRIKEAHYCKHYYSELENEQHQSFMSELSDFNGNLALTISSGTHKFYYTPIDPTKIKTRSFSDCQNLTSITIPYGVTTIESEAFSGYTENDTVISSCTRLSEVNIPNTVSSIGNKAFYGCTSLQEIDLGKGITSIADSAFGNCDNLESVICRAKVPPILGGRNALAGDYIIYVPAESLTAYQTDGSWATYASRIQAIPTE